MLGRPRQILLSGICSFVVAKGSIDYYRVREALKFEASFQHVVRGARVLYPS